MKGKEIVEDFVNRIDKVDPELMGKIQVLSSIASMKIYDLHARAIACHCECMGMNAENAAASCKGDGYVPYGDASFYSVMEKWGMMDNKGNPII